MAFFPIPNLNGQTRENLIAENHEVVAAINKAVGLAGRAAPHGRDFQLNPQDYNEARDKHFERIRALERVRDEFQLIVDFLVQGDR